MKGEFCYTVGNDKSITLRGHLSSTSETEVKFMNSFLNNESLKSDVSLKVTLFFDFSHWVSKRLRESMGKTPSISKIVPIAGMGILKALCSAETQRTLIRCQYNSKCQSIKYSMMRKNLNI